MDTLFFIKKRFTWLVLIAIGILTIPGPWFFPRPDLDASGMIGLYLAQLKHFQIGLDEVSQFGPLAFLYAPTYIDPSLWFPAMIYRLASHSIFLFAVGLFLMKSSVTWKENLLILSMLPAMALLTSINGNNDYELISSLVIFLYLIITHKIGIKYEMLLLTLVSFAFAVESLIKFTMTVSILSMIVMFSLISIVSKEYKRALTVCIFFSIFLLILWVGSGQYLSNLPSWLVNNVEFSYGYSYGNAIDGPKFQLVEAVVGIIFAVILSIYAFVKRDKNLTIFILLNGELLFESFKHGFVRQDAHVNYFFFYYALFFILTYIIYKQNNEDKKYHGKVVLKVPLLVLSVIFVANILFLSLASVEASIPQAISMYGSVPSLMFDHSRQSQMIEDAKTLSKNHYQLGNETINYIGNKTMDVFPWDIGVPWIYDLNWSPRPMFWSFQVFSSYLDKLNAQHFLDKKDAPQTILYAYKSVDNRYPLFDEPLTFQAILHNYQYVQTSGEFALLSYSPKEQWGPEQDLGIVEGELGKPIKIPKYDDGYEFADIDLNFSSLGKFMNIIYKPSLAHIRFKFSDSTYSQEFRFLPGASKDGVFVSQYIDSVYDLPSILSGKIAPNIDEMTITADYPTHYEKTVRVKFVGIPTQVSIEQNKENKIPVWSSLKPVQGGMMAIDWIDNIQYAKQGIVVNVNDETGHLVTISGWAVDNLSKDGAVKTFLEFRDGEKEITLPTKKMDRPDLVDAYGVPSYTNGGWYTVFDTKEFGHECYTLSLYIPRSNGQEYFKISSDKSICFG